MSLEKHVAVITGAAGGLGSLVTRTLAGSGAALALLGLDAGKLDALAGSLSLPDSRLLTRSVDLREPAQVESAVQAVVDWFGGVDILLHLVGGWTGGKTLFEASSQDLAFMLNQHIWTSFNVIQAFVPLLIKNGWGRVVMVSSPFASRPSARGGPYAAGKSGQEALVLTLAQELKGTGVTANLLLVRTIDVKRGKLSAPSPENASWSTPEELGAGIQYLLSDEAGTVNGARIPMYGSYI